MIKQFLRSQWIVLTMLVVTLLSCLVAFDARQELEVRQVEANKMQVRTLAQSDHADYLIRALKAANKKNAELQKKLYSPLPDLREFNSLKEMQLFLANDNTDRQFYIRNVHDCTDASRQLVERAAEKGFKLYMVVMPRERHMMVMAVVEDYLVDTPHEVKFIVLIEPLADMWQIVGLWDNPETWWEEW